MKNRIWRPRNCNKDGEREYLEERDFQTTHRCSIAGLPAICGGISMMRYCRPYFYDKFQCTAGKCPDTCCAGWQIGIDEESQERYAHAEGTFGRRLRNGIDWMEEAFIQSDGKCSFLDRQGLCEIYLKLGEDAMCETCKGYPRHTEEFDGVREYSLALSCPEAARLLLENPEPFRFAEEVTEEPEPLAEEFEEFDTELFETLREIRPVLYKIIGRSSWSFEERALAMLSVGRELQECLDGERIAVMQRAAMPYAEGKRGEKPAESRFRLVQRGLEALEGLNVLRDEWLEVLDDAGRLYASGEEAYGRLLGEFRISYGQDSANGEAWELLGQNLLVFFVYNYFCGAAYDGRIYGKISLAVFSACMIREFILTRWLKKGKALAWEDCVENAYRYAREVEHLDGNLEALEEWLSGS